MATYILLHGAYLGGWSWKYVAARLKDKGHTVYAPSLDGNAERRHTLRPGITVETQAREIADLMFYEDVTEVVLVSTSTGSMVACRVAELARERIHRLVFVDSLMPLSGERISDMATNRPEPKSLEVAVQPSREDQLNRIFVALDGPLKDWVVERATPHPIGVMTEPVHLANFWTEKWIASVVWCRQTANPPLAHQRRTAELLKARWFELDAGHYPMFTNVDALVDVIIVDPSIESL